MKERPILFSGAMVRELLVDRKTQTRRIMKPQPHPRFLARGLVAATPQWPHQNGVRFFMADGMSELVPCPYGAPGDRLWVRETWSIRAKIGTGVVGLAWRADDEEPRWVPAKRPDGSPFIAGELGAFKWHPSIHMPRWASRITLEIGAVRVERLQDITPEDAMREGVDWIPHTAHGGGGLCGAFASLWDTINGKRAPWASNPWVWSITFRRLQ